MKYVYRREYKEMEHNNQKVWLVLAQATESSLQPERSGVVRVKEYISYSALTSDGKGGTKGRFIVFLIVFLYRGRGLSSEVNGLSS